MSIFEYDKELEEKKLRKAEYEYVRAAHLLPSYAVQPYQFECLFLYICEKIF